jgi:hypothetical protein
MHFLIDADMPRKTADVLIAAGHVVTDVRDIGLGAADDAIIADHAKANGFALITGDFGFADIRNYPPHEYHGLVVFEFPPTATAPFILRLVQMFVDRGDVIAKLSGRLAIVDPWHIRLRPA